MLDQDRINLIGLTVVLAALLVPGAQAEIPAAEREILEDFYVATNGDDWHRNDGWLDPDTPVCDWFGIGCHFSNQLDRQVLQRMELPANNLTGELSALPLVIRTVVLADNHLTGPLPEVPDGDEIALQRLDLSRNALTGPVPDSWAGLELRDLKLPGNGLEGSIEPALAALSLDELVHLDVADNQFSGPIPEDMMALQPYSLEHHRLSPVHHWGSAFPPGLNLCWNDFDPPDGELADFIDLHHHGGRFAGCQRPRRAIDPLFSGSWFDPERAGEGFVQHLLDTGEVLLFWFTFPTWDEGGQPWFLGLVPAGETSVRFENLHHFSGHFGSGSHSQYASPFRLSVDALQSYNQHIAYSRSIITTRSPTGSVTYGLESLRHDQVPLTRLAGSTCDNQRSTQHLSGAWYSPDRAGEGFMVEVNEDGRGVVYWFTYMPDESGQRVWMIGTGEFEQSGISIGTPPPGTPEYQLTIDTMYRPTGTVFGTDFESDDIEFEDWGSLSIDFYRQATGGHVFWESNDETFGSGDYEIEMLARPMLAECEPEE